MPKRSKTNEEKKLTFSEEQEKQAIFEYLTGKPVDKARFLKVVAEEGGEEIVLEITRPTFYRYASLVAKKGMGKKNTGQAIDDIKERLVRITFSTTDSDDYDDDPFMKEMMIQAKLMIQEVKTEVKTGIDNYYDSKRKPPPKTGAEMSRAWVKKQHPDYMKIHCKKYNQIRAERNRKKKSEILKKKIMGRKTASTTTSIEQGISSTNDSSDDNMDFHLELDDNNGSVVDDNNGSVVPFGSGDGSESTDQSSTPPPPPPPPTTTRTTTRGDGSESTNQSTTNQSSTTTTTPPPPPTTTTPRKRSHTGLDPLGGILGSLAGPGVGGTPTRRNNN